MTGDDASQRLWAVRGAVQVERNAREPILSSTTELMSELMARNRLEPDRMVSCIFTCTEDLDAEFPAVAARELGLGEVPLLCNRELDVPGAMARVIRVLVHYYSGRNHAPEHIYLGAAQALRADLHSAQ